MSGRSKRALVRPIRLAHVSGVVAGACVAYVVVGGARDGDPSRRLAMWVAVFICVMGVLDTLQSRHRRRPLAAGELIHLRLMDRRDAPAFAATITPDVVAENRWEPHIRLEYIDAAKRAALGSVWAICARSTGDIVGVITAAESSPGEVVLGMWVGPPHRAKGYASAAVVALVRLLGPSKYDGIAASTAVTNAPMQAALLRAGFAEEKRYDHEFPNGETTPAIRYVRPLSWVDQIEAADSQQS